MQLDIEDLALFMNLSKPIWSNTAFTESEKSVTRRSKRYARPPSTAARAEDVVKTLDGLQVAKELLTLTDRSPSWI